MKVIITGATGMVGEGVLFECLENQNVETVLIVGRRHYDMIHPKLKELLVRDFMNPEGFSEQLKGYDACFYCAGISSIGVKEEAYTHATFDTTLAFAKTVLQLNPDMVFNFVSGSGTDSSGKGKVMWARVKGKTENALMNLFLKNQYNFRPALMKGTKGQVNVKTIYKILAFLISPFFPKKTLTLKQVGQAMINTVLKGYSKQILEVNDIAELAKQ
jgi:uncharacterized protein YbjT (DUF2867 family)